MTSQTLLIKNADLLCTMAVGHENLQRDNNIRQKKDTISAEIKNGGLFAKNGVIESVGHTSELPGTADKVIDMTGHVVIPGMVNTHHHMFQMCPNIFYLYRVY